MAPVFISYVRENQDQIDKLYKDFTMADVKVWLDRNDLAPGAFWEEAIRQAIKNGAFFIACFSKEYNVRSTSYMNEELNLAIGVLRQRPRNQSWFIPVLFSGEVPDWDIVPGKTLKSIQYVPLDDKNWDAGIRRILSVIQPDAVKSTSPSEVANDSNSKQQSSEKHEYPAVNSEERKLQYYIRSKQKAEKEAESWEKKRKGVDPRLAPYQYEMAEQHIELALEDVEKWEQKIQQLRSQVK